jgi:molybdopterin synthase catalytic subunit
MKTNDLIRVQEADFDISEHYHQLRQINPAGTGAVVVFVGLVRDLDDAKLEAMELEHYPGMTELEIESIITNSSKRWEISSVTVIHRIGKLFSSDQIVFVGVASKHRQNAFDACNYIMDWLKTKAPFWKKELGQDGESWVEQRQSDLDAMNRWD